jgi:hypothetical protein
VTPTDFLKEESENVERALRETLRYDYGPERSIEYYDECAARLQEIKKAVTVISPSDSQTISAYLTELANLATWISLFERSHLGEFSWPFADELRRMATILLADQNLKGDRLDPIVQVIAEGEGYRIVYEHQVPATSGGRRFVVVAFPRSIKHHVLLHTIFGHELGHTALHTARAGVVLHRKVLTPLTASGPLSNESQATAWINDILAPNEIADVVQQYQHQQGVSFRFTEHTIRMWLIELICDIFGLLLFGPGFLGAHRTLLQPMHPNAYTVDLTEPTHPPYAVRHKMLVQAMHVLGWHKPLTDPSHAGFHRAEIEFLKYILDDPYDTWAVVFDNAQLADAIAGMRKIFAPYPDLAYEPTDSETLIALLKRLARTLPPVLAEIDLDGQPVLKSVGISQILYAGWVYWEGRGQLASETPLSFFVTNRLCDHALLQQRAIAEILSSGVV